jgi:hypothetical protein
MNAGNAYGTIAFGPESSKGGEVFQPEEPSLPLFAMQGPAEVVVWRGPGEWDSSDEEWEEDFWTPIVQQREDVDPLVDTRSMVEDAFRQADEAPGLEGRVQDIVLDTFTVVDEVHA